MNRYPLWKNLLVLVVLIIATVYAMPNLFGDDPAVQISAGRTATVDLDLVNQAETALKDAGIELKGAELEEDKLLIRLTSPGEQLRAKEVLSQSLSEDFIVALNLAPTTPNWLASLGAEPMNLGLDLRGGVHFLMEVDMDAAVKQALESYASDLRLSLRDEKNPLQADQDRYATAHRGLS
jgi:preprotein translocase subunit SecD